MAEWIIRDSRSAGMVLHPSTECALEALKELGNRLSPTESPVTRILDIGCGSGLLALAAAGLWPDAQIIASDISPEAVQDAGQNIQAYELQNRVSVVRADAYHHGLIRSSGPYELILCNLLADILIRTALDLKAHLAPAGVAVLSGILAWMLPQVVEAHLALGFEIIGEIEMGEWRALLVCHKDAP